MAEIFYLRLKWADLASKSDITNFVNKTDFDNKLKILHQIKINQINYQKKVKAISTKGLTKDLINKLSILNRANIFLKEYFKII